MSSGGYANSSRPGRMLKEKQWSSSSKKLAPIESLPKYRGIQKWLTGEFDISQVNKSTRVVLWWKKNQEILINCYTIAHATINWKGHSEIIINSRRSLARKRGVPWWSCWTGVPTLIQHDLNATCMERSAVDYLSCWGLNLVINQCGSRPMVVNSTSMMISLNRGSNLGPARSKCYVHGALSCGLFILLGLNLVINQCRLVLLPGSSPRTINNPQLSAQCT